MTVSPCALFFFLSPTKANQRQKKIRAEVDAKYTAAADDDANNNNNNHDHQPRVNLDYVLRQLETGRIRWRTAVASQRVAIRLENVASRASIALGKKMRRLKQPNCALAEWQYALASHGGQDATVKIFFLLGKQQCIFKNASDFIFLVHAIAFFFFP